MAQIYEFERLEQTQDLCPGCGSEVALASSGDVVEAACDCGAFLVA